MLKSYNENTTVLSLALSTGAGYANSYPAPVLKVLFRKLNLGFWNFLEESMASDTKIGP